MRTPDDWYLVWCSDLSDDTKHFFKDIQREALEESLKAIQSSTTLKEAEMILGAEIKRIG